MNRREILSLSGALTAATLAGCTSGGQTVTRDETPTGTPTDATTEEPASDDLNINDERLVELAADNVVFALDLHKQLASGEKGNQFLSPYSISVALAMTYAGARGETREQMTETLQFTLEEDLHPAFADLQAVLTSRETTEDPIDGEEVNAFQLDVANALWGREDYPFAEDFLKLLDKYYGSGLRQADFVGNPADERERINEWVADATEGRINDLLPPDSITAQTILVITNAIYFMASWAHEFNPENTEDATFTALDGSESIVPMMRQELRTNHASVGGIEAVELPYVGEEVSMVLILPKEGQFETFEQNLNADKLLGIFDELSDARGELALPKFEFETEVQLSEVLAELGMSVAFTSSADFSGMVKENGGGLWIDEVFHDTFITVDEEGTEAAAATGVIMQESAPPQWGSLQFDRPFLFCIRDRPTDAVLFLGRVVDAGAAQGDQ